MEQTASRAPRTARRPIVVRTVLFIALGTCVPLGTAIATPPLGCEAPPTDFVEVPGDRILAQQPQEVADQLRTRGWAMRPAPAPPDNGCGAYVQGFVIFSVPRAQALDLLIQSDRHDEFLPRVDDIMTVAKYPGYRVDQHRLRVVFMTLRYRVRSDWSYEHWRMWWSLDPSFENGISDLRGFWQLYDLGEGSTLGQYMTRVDVSGVLPARMQETLSRRTVSESLGRFRLWVDSGGRYRP